MGETEKSKPTNSQVCEDQVVPFQVDDLDVRGRAIQLGPLINTILDGHQYPEPVSRLLAEAIVLGVLLGSSLKFEGRFTIQTQSDGPVSFLVVDFKTPDGVRAYASFDEGRIAECIEQENLDTPALLGKGVLAMTIDQGLKMQNYQGIVALDDLSFEDIAHQYFSQSEQIPTKVRLATARLIQSNKGANKDGTSTSSWRAGGLIAQFLPDAPERMKMPDLPSGDDETDHNDNYDIDDAWREAVSLVSTIGDDELCDPQLSSDGLLYRLFHQNGVRIFDSTSILARCSCSKEKITNVIAGLPDDELTAAFEASEIPDVIVSKCEYCSTVYQVDAADLLEKQ